MIILKSEPYDPSWLVELFSARLNAESSDAQRILQNLKLCTRTVGYCSCGCGDPYFINPDSDDWKFKTNVTANHDGKLIVLDIMQDLTIGSVEIVDDFPFDLDSMQSIEVD